MKKIIFSLLIIFMFALPVSAHPGKTDKYGGHYDNETGEYHYHHGYPAHEHVNGVCPYDFDDKTNHQSGTSSNSTATKKPEYHVETPDPLSPVIADTKPISTPTPTTKPTATQNKSINTAFLLLPCAAVAGTAGYFIKRRKRKSNDIVIIDEPLQLPEPESIEPPEGYAIGDDGLPYKTNREYGWGKEFNVFVTKYGKCYHRSRCNALTPTNKRLLHRYTAIKYGYRPCPHCKPKCRIDDWYIKN